MPRPSARKIQARRASQGLPSATPSEATAPPLSSGSQPDPPDDADGSEGLTDDILTLSDGDDDGPLFDASDPEQNPLIFSTEESLIVVQDGSEPHATVADILCKWQAALGPGVEKKKRILTERGLPTTGLNNDGLRALLEAQPDFVEQKSWLEEVVRNGKHLIDFYPKFHCEFNFIERIWGFSKREVREQCDYTWASLQVKVPATLNRISRECLDVVKRFARKAARYIHAYRLKNLTFEQVQKAVKKYSSHRRIGAHV